jgi:hypothetical protein
VLADTTIVASWAGEDSLVLELYARAHKDDAGVTEAAAHAARNLRRYDFSIQLYRHSEALAPERRQSIREKFGITSPTLALLLRERRLNLYFSDSEQLIHVDALTDAPFQPAASPQLSLHTVVVE